MPIHTPPPTMKDVRQDADERPPSQHRRRGCGLSEPPDERDVHELGPNRIAPGRSRT